VWTGDRRRASAVAHGVRTGSFGINRFGPDPSTPFGGYKASGVGREYGMEGLKEFTEIKSIHGI
jgi:aldehyde dehydrogenase (NAD+)